MALMISEVCSRFCLGTPVAKKLNKLLTQNSYHALILHGMRSIHALLIVLGLLAGLSGCKQDEPLPQSPPSTRIFVKEVNRSGADRLRSIVHLHWSGNDRDGIVIGFELSFDNQNWAFTTRTDSIFSFNIRTQSDTTDVNFWVRAVDNDNLRDPNPAFLRIPIRNTPPQISYDTTFFRTDTHRVVFTFAVQASDPDGPQTLDRIEIKANDGNWTQLPPNVGFLTLVPVPNNQSGRVRAEVLDGTTGRSLNAQLDGINLGGSNVLYLKAVDQGSLESRVDTTSSVVLLPRTADWLVLDLWRQNSGFVIPSGRPIVTYRSELSSAGISFDYFDLTNPNLVLPLRNSTLSALLRQYPKVFLFTSRGDPEVALVNSLETGIQSFLTGGGRLLLNVPYTIGDPNPNDPFLPVTFRSLFLYSPADSVSSVFTNGSIPIDGALRPDSRGGAGYPELVNGSRLAGREQLISRVNPFYLKPGAEAIYRADLVQAGGEPWGGSRIVMARLRNAAGNSNIIYSSVALHEVNGNRNLADVLRQVAREFNW